MNISLLQARKEIDFSGSDYSGLWSVGNDKFYRLLKSLSPLKVLGLITSLPNFLKYQLLLLPNH